MKRTINMFGPFSTTFDLERACLMMGCNSVRVTEPKRGTVLVDAVKHGRIDYHAERARLESSLLLGVPVGAVLDFKLFNERHEKEVVMPMMRVIIETLRGNA